LIVYGEDTVDVSTVHLAEKGRDNGGNLYLDDWLQSGRPVTATHDLNRQKVDSLSRRLANSSENHSGKVKLRFG
jgi:hypothetical protein